MILAHKMTDVCVSYCHQDGDDGDRVGGNINISNLDQTVKTLITIKNCNNDNNNNYDRNNDDRRNSG